ncbi:GNAT family N-acetyltransferase [Fictibacillus sp. 7GRE50]|uniref:GNAT family N-acetyltransferase n=1 Tax=Fictibacillus TaxID=1329200 RepID=UPI0018CD9F2F|nr:GNAT family N-acetyltransferase [Fictibacillus sp. 7GRE50]MBH0164904.1 GNAT family N-acetyltransferase [Fictibacillus sp. 7GRE50]
MNIHFRKMLKPEENVVEALNRWENDTKLVPLTRPNKDRVELESKRIITIEDLYQRLEFHAIYLIFVDDQLVGEMNYMVDPPHLFNRTEGTAWLGITIGESIGRGKGIGFQALSFLEGEIKSNGLKRIELGVFEFNYPAQKLYQKLGYSEIGRVEAFTYYKDRMWADIRMEKLIK